MSLTETESSNDDSDDSYQGEARACIEESNRLYEMGHEGVLQIYELWPEMS